MKLLLTTIRSASPESELALRYLYSITEGAPVETTLQAYDEVSLDSKIFNDIVKGQYNMVHFQCDEFNEHRINKLSEMVKKAIPSAVVSVGGMQVSVNTRSYMVENPYVDFVIRGEGEMVFFNFLKSILTYSFDFDSIAGLAFRNGEDITVNHLDGPVDLEELPFPYEKTELKEGEVVYYETMRGTSDLTIFTQSLPDTKVRTLPLGRVCTELRYFLVKRASRVVFLDKWINFNPERAYRIFEYLISNDNGYTSFEMEIDGDNLDDETIRLLSEARKGLFKFHLDIGSTNPETLDNMGRRENVYQLMYNVTKLLQVDTVDIAAHITAGLPMESERLFARSFNKIYGLVEGRGLVIDNAVVKKGTAARKEAGRMGLLYSGQAPYTVIATSHMTALELIKVKSICATAERFLGAGCQESLKRLMNDCSLRPYDMFAGLTEYIESEKLEKKMSKVENLFRIIYHYATGLYDELNDTLKLQILMDVLQDEVEKALSTEDIMKFENKGWEI